MLLEKTLQYKIQATDNSCLKTEKAYVAFNTLSGFYGLGPKI